MSENRKEDRNMRELVRHVQLGATGYQLKVWDTYTYDNMLKSRLAYEFCAPSGDILFSGEDFYCSPCHSVDADETVRSLLGFLTLRPGDTDKEYFDHYTPEQLEFCRNDAEYLSLWSNSTDAPEPLIDLDSAD